MIQDRAVAVERCLLPTLSALAGLDVHTPTLEGEAVRNSSVLSEQLSRLRGLLAESDTAAVDALAELRKLSLEKDLAKRLALVTEQVELFEFDRALELLQEG
ncbi:hypothetical protein D3C73_1353620 [compost metagenome]